MCVPTNIRYFFDLNGKLNSSIFIVFVFIYILCVNVYHTVYVV